MFKNELLSVIDKYIPQVSCRTTHHLPWLNKHIRSKMKQRKWLYDKAKVSQLPQDWAAYRTIKNEINYDIKRSHTSYQNRLFDNEGHVSKHFWKYVKNLRKDCVGVSPLKLDGKILIEKANALNNQFYSVFTNEDLTNLPQAGMHPFSTSPFPLKV